MYIAIDNEGITYHRADKSYVTFHWYSLLLTFFSSRKQRSYFTVVHYALAALATVFARKKKKSHIDMSNMDICAMWVGDLMMWDPVSRLMIDLATEGRENFVIIANSGGGRELLEMTADFKRVGLYPRNNPYVVITRPDEESLKALLAALHACGAHVIGYCQGGNLSNDH